MLKRIYGFLGGIFKNIWKGLLFIFNVFHRILNFLNNYYRTNMVYFLRGAIAAIFIIGIFLVLCFWFNPFNFQFHLITFNTHILNVSKVDSLLNNSEHLNSIKELSKYKLILTPQEYTNNVIQYYNTVLTLMAGMLVIFSVIAYFQLKFSSKREINEELKVAIKDSITFRATLKDTLFGKAQDKFATLDEVKELLTNEIAILREELVDLHKNKTSTGDRVK